MHKLAWVALLASACAETADSGQHDETNAGPLNALDAIVNATNATNAQADPHIGSGRAGNPSLSLRIATNFAFGTSLVGTRATTRLVLTNSGPPRFPSMR